MIATVETLVGFLLDGLHQVRDQLGLAAATDAAAATPLGDVLDSMAMIEFLALTAEACGVKPTAIEECVGRRFSTVGALAEALRRAAIFPQQAAAPAERAAPSREPVQPQSAYLAAAGTYLPKSVQPATEVDRLLHRPLGWFARHTGIQARRLWAGEDPLAGAAAAGRQCLEQAGLLGADVGALLVTSETPPLLAGLAAALHQQLDLPPRTVALEIGGACTGFLAALWTARHLLPAMGNVLILAVEAPARYLAVEPGPAGEAAALFGEGAAAVLLRAEPTALPVREVCLRVDGGARSLLRPERDCTGKITLHLDGATLATRALEALTDTVAALLQCHTLPLADVQALVIHGGNGRMPALLARRLGLPAARVWSTTPTTGNLGSASLPAAWALGTPTEGPVLWVGVGAGLTWGGMLLLSPAWL
jgi:3-oxoacyl-[acyl-carrier-protein] synthase-3